MPFVVVSCSDLANHIFESWSPGVDLERLDDELPHHAGIVSDLSAHIRHDVRQAVVMLHHHHFHFMVDFF